MKTKWLSQSLIVAASFLSLDALAESTAMLKNAAGRPLCIAVGLNRSVDFQVSAEMNGWNCINDGEVFNVNLDGDRKVAIRELSGSNYLIGSRATRYPAAEFYVPSNVVDQFGLIIGTEDGGFYYSYHIGPNVWSDKHSVSDFSDLEILLAARGFVPVNGWTFSASIYPGGLGLLLNE